MNCCYHPEIHACGICSRCGRDLCSDCFLQYERNRFCRKCKPNFLFTILKFKSYLLNPVSILILIIVLFSILYLTVGGGKINVINEHSPEKELAKKDIAIRNWLYLGKAVRLKLYADHLKEMDRTDLAKRTYYRTRLALEHLLQENTYPNSDAANMSDGLIKPRMAELLISIASCYLGEDKIQSAIKTLNESLKTSTQPETAGLAYYNLGKIYEEKIKDYHKAISMYKSAQKGALKPSDLWENMLDSLAKPVNEKRIANTVRQLAGSYDPAEAQSRVINCYQKLGMTDKITEERQALISQYPFFEQAIEAQGPIEIETEKETETEKEKAGNEKEKESMEIIPL